MKSKIKNTIGYKLGLIKEFNQKKQVTDKNIIFEEMQDIKDSEKELFVAFYLDTKNNIIAREIISIGVLDAAIVHPREVFKGAILHNANRIILSHNHPSGDSKPSKEDLNITEQMFKAGEILGIKLLDHVIIGKNSCYSWNDEK